MEYYETYLFSNLRSELSTELVRVTRFRRFGVTNRLNRFLNKPFLTLTYAVNLKTRRQAYEKITEKCLYVVVNCGSLYVKENWDTFLCRNKSKGDTKPRYVRINTLFISLEEAVDGFRNEGWELCKFFDKTDYKGFLHKISTLSENEFLIDIHVPNLLIFPPKTEFYHHPAYQDGSIILQDKASCLPVHILNPSPNSVVLDMCAAPGMKTTQLAAVMANQGTIYAVERNPKRFETLNKIVESSKATCIKTENKDVLTCFAGDFKGVQYILVDPSCSGSGMTDRLECEQKVDQERIEKLAGFQIKILRSALTRYPDAKRVVYSTCSIYPEENEDVVRQVLETNTTFKLVPAKQFVNDTWQNVGSSDYGEIGKYCLYAKPNEDLTNGFFVAIFERLEKDEVNKFFNTKVYNYKRHVQSQENRKKRRQEANEENFGGHYDYRDETTIKEENEKANTVIKKEEREIIHEEEIFGNIKDSESYENDNLEEIVIEGRQEENAVLKKKKKKRKQSVVNDNALEETENVVGDSEKEYKRIKELNETDEVVEIVKPKKKKKVKSGELLSDSQEIVDEFNNTMNINEQLGINQVQDHIKPVKDKKKKKDISKELLVPNELAIDLKRKKKSSTDDMETIVDRESKKKKRKHIEDASIEYDMEIKHKKRKKQKTSECITITENSNVVEEQSSSDMKEIVGRKSKKQKETSHEGYSEVKAIKNKKDKFQEPEDITDDNCRFLPEETNDGVKKKKKKRNILNVGP